MSRESMAPEEGFSYDEWLAYQESQAETEELFDRQYEEELQEREEYFLNAEEYYNEVYHDEYYYDGVDW